MALIEGPTTATIKCKFQEDIRRRSVELTAGTFDLETLNRAAVRLFGLDEAIPLQLLWIDEDGDFITIDSDADAQEACRSMDPSKPVLRIEMRIKPVSLSSAVESAELPDLSQPAAPAESQSAVEPAQPAECSQPAPKADDLSAAENEDDESACGVCKQKDFSQLKGQVHETAVRMANGARGAMQGVAQASRAGRSVLTEGVQAAVFGVTEVSKKALSGVPEGARAIIANLTEVKDAIVAGAPQAAEQVLGAVANGAEQAHVATAPLCSALKDLPGVLRLEKLVNSSVKRNFSNCTSDEAVDDGSDVPVEFASMIHKLTEMGFSQSVAREAVLNSQGDIDKATEEALAYVPPTPPKAALVECTPAPEPEEMAWDQSWDDLLPELEEMGFLNKEGNKEAVAAHNGDLKNTVAALVREERARHQK